MRKKSDNRPLGAFQGESYLALQEEWYQKLAAAGFEDAEDTNIKGFEDGRPLRKWSGISNWIHSSGEEPFDVFVLELADLNQPPQCPIISSWPDPLFSQEEEFLHRSDFHEICKNLFSHGNSACTPETAIAIWSDYCSGDSQRMIENRYGISDTTILRITNKLTEWMNMSETSGIEEGGSGSKIIVREFNPMTDSGLVYSTWRRSLWYDEPREESLAHAFFSATTKHIKSLLSKRGAHLKIACFSDDPDLIVGYSLFVGTHLEWCYVKIDSRNQGIATLLTKGLTSISQPATKIGRSIAASHELKIKENDDEKRNKRSPDA